VVVNLESSNKSKIVSVLSTKNCTGGGRGRVPRGNLPPLFKLEYWQV